MGGARAHPGSLVPHSTVCLSHHGLLNSFWTELPPQLTVLLWLRQIHLPVLTFVLAPWLTVSSCRAPAQTEWYFMSVCKTDTQELHCLGNFMLQLTPLKAGVGQLSRNLHQALSAVVVRTSGWNPLAGKAERSSCCSSSARPPTPVRVSA